MLRLNNITKRFGELKVLDNFTYHVPRNKITALVGPNGAGKTTLFNIITGMLNQDNGKVHLQTEDITSLGMHKISKLGVSRVFQQVTCFKNLTVKEHLMLCFEDSKRFSFNLSRRKKLNRKRMKALKGVLRLVGLSKPLDSLAVELSYGQKKLLGLAMAILKPHKVLLLDEPVAGVNPILKKKIQDILLSLKSNGETIFVVEHDMNFVKGVADEVVVLNNGKILASGEPEKVLKNKKVVEAYLGE